ncbi:MAG: hypothetical protein GF330_02395 [Candidatus Eisenbacteria bacterium]|nr:hypothetical protein [Candidatus Eisenbacteria bacterium]
MAALTAALMSTIDTLINASTAIGIYDVYKPLIKRDAPDRHYLKASRYVSVLVTLLGLGLVPVFSQVESIFAAHYAFVAMVTPPLLVPIFLGVLWRRFSPQAAFWCMVGGGIFILISVQFPEIVAPLAHLHGINVPGTPDFDPAYNYKYFRGLYGLLVTILIGVVATFFTKPKPKEEIIGLTLGTIQAGKALFKGGKPNEEPGRKIRLQLAIRETPSETVQLHPDDLAVLHADAGDMLYVADARRILGGLRSLHVKAGDPGGERGMLGISADLVEEGNLRADCAVRVEKIL